MGTTESATPVEPIVMPFRVQRKRTKGYRMPPNTVSVCRPGRFGNPFTADECRAAGYEGTDLQIKQCCVSAFRAWLCDKDGWLNWQGDEAEKVKAAILEGLESLRGKNLACFCKLGEPCHADVLLELANDEGVSNVTQRRSIPLRRVNDVSTSCRVR